MGGKDAERRPACHESGLVTTGVVFTRRCCTSCAILPSRRLLHESSSTRHSALPAPASAAQVARLVSAHPSPTSR